MGGGIESVAGKGTGNPRILVLNYSHFPPPPPPPASGCGEVWQCLETLLIVIPGVGVLLASIGT